MMKMATEMITPTKNLINFILLIILSILIILGCASYPDDPKSPKVGDDTYAVEEDGFLPVTAKEGILENDRPEEGDEAILLTVEEQTTDQGGLAVIASDGSFTYEPAANFHGTDQLAYIIENVKGKQSSGTIFFEVSSVNDPPLAQDDVIATPATDSIVINVLENDTDPDGDTMRLVEVDELNLGSAQITEDNQIVFTPPANHSGDIKFKYIIADAVNEQAEAWVSLTVVDEGNSVVATEDAMTVTEDVPGTITVSELLSNDQDLLNGTLSIIELGEPQNGTAVLEGETLTYASNPDFSGTDTFTYTVQSDSGGTASALVNVTITPVNDPPTISHIENQTVEAGRTAGPIQFTIEDLDNGQAELTVTANASGATPANVLPANAITLTGGGTNRTIRIASTADVAGSATITINVTDGELSSAESFLLTTTAPIPVSVILYWDDLFGGSTLTLTENNSCLVANGWNDEVSSIRVIGNEGDYVTIYQDCDYGGYAINLAVGSYTLAQLRMLGMLNDDISAVRITNGH